MKYKIVTLLSLFVLLAVQELTTVQSAPAGVSIHNIELNAADFAGGTGTGYAITADGLTMADDAVTAVYTSPVIQSPIPFNAAVPQWFATVPDMTSMELHVRTKAAAGEWGKWVDIHENDDWTLPDDPDIVGEMLAVPAADVTHHQLQFSVIFSRYAGEPAPVFEQLTLTVIDTTDGPTLEEMQARQAELDAANASLNQTPNDSYPRPTVISREVWCYYDDCNYDPADLAYSPYTHMVIHHTVSSNESSDWAAIVRAIWNFHTYTRGWGDIGYNYLVDRTGVVYEGHLNEDYLNLDVVGTHASAANTGGMGVALIGTFSTPDEYPGFDETPPPEMQAAAVELLSWKADQRDIDVYDASRMVYTDWGLPHLMGHRDVYGGTSTTCPGANAYGLLPALRDAVAQQIGFVSPHMYVDELSDAFTMSDSVWYEGPEGCGNNGHSYYTWNVTDEALSDNWGEWRPDVPEYGRYEIEVYAPYCDTNAPETDGAIYTVTHADGTDTVTVSHNANVGLWMSLGEFNLNAGTGNLIRLTDLTSGDLTDYDYGVWFDAIRLRLIEGSASNAAPPDDAWVTQQSVDFAWEIVNPGTVLTTTLQVATDPAFSDMVYTESWGTAVTNTVHTFSQDYADLYWRVRLNLNAGDQVESAATRFGLDSAPPTSSVNALTFYPAEGYYELGWQGSDNLSGIAGYNIEYRADSDLTWTTLLSATTLITATFTPPDPAQMYWFRSQASDAAGNTEPAHSGDGDINTEQADVIYTIHVQNETPAADVWLNGLSVDFSWAITTAIDISTTTWAVATDPAMTNVVAAQSWGTAVTQTLHSFTQDYADLYWQVTVTDTETLSASSTPTRFGLDTTPPTSQVTMIYELSTGSYFLLWQGDDAGSGLALYTVEYRAQGETDWITLVDGVTAVSAMFDPPVPGQIYEFRSQATDLVGNIEPPHPNPDMDTTQAILLSHAIMLPIIQR